MVAKGATSKVITKSIILLNLTNNTKKHFFKTKISETANFGKEKLRQYPFYEEPKLKQKAKYSNLLVLI